MPFGFGSLAASAPDQESMDPDFLYRAAEIARKAKFLRDLYPQEPMPEDVSVPRVDVPGQPTQQQQADFGDAQAYSARAGKGLPPEAPTAEPPGGVTKGKMRAGKIGDALYAVLANLANIRESKDARQSNRSPHHIGLDLGVSRGLEERKAAGEKEQAGALAENEKRGMLEGKLNREQRQGYYERAGKFMGGTLPSVAGAMFRDEKKGPTGDAAMFDIFQKDPEAFSQFQDAMHPQQGRAAAPASQFYALMMQQGHSPEEALAITQRMFGHQGAAATDPRQAFIQRQFQAYTNPANFSSMTPEQAFQAATKDAEMLYPQAPAGPAPGAPQPGGTGGAPGQGPYPTAPPSNQFPYGPYDPTGGQGGGGQQQPDMMGQSTNTPPPQLNRLAQGWKMAAERNPAKAEEMRESFKEQYGYDPEAVLSGGY